jgi:replicative superfamily II helicase
MQLSDLEKFGIPSRIVDIWRKRQGEVLLPVQREAVRQGLLGTAATGLASELSLPNMIVSSPTSSGKSFCAEMAAVKALTARQKAVLLFPLKSLAEEKYRLFRDAYGPLGIDCLIATGDHPENDQKFLRGDFQLAVSIYEKFDLLLTIDLDLLSNIGLVVVDELQMLGDRERGLILERLLTKVIASAYEPAVLGLSAVLEDSAAHRLAQWLSARLVRENSRPVDLLRGIAAEGSFRFRSFNSSEDGDEPFDTVRTGDDPAEVLIERLKEDSGAAIVFLKSRRDTVRLAFKLAASVNWPEAKTALAKLKDEEPSFLVRSLTQALTRGVAFHNSDLTPHQRGIIEGAFATGEIKVLCSTTTLALGINLPADIVYLETVKYASGNYDNRPVLIPISRSEFDNMTGRSGRYGIGRNSPGRAIILADSEFDRDVLWQTYIAPDQPETLCSSFASVSLENWLLDMICAGLVDDLDSARRILKCGLKAVEEPAAEFDPQPAIDQLTEEQLVRQDPTGLITATPLGKAAATSGLSIREAVHFHRLLENGFPESTFGWTAMALSSPDWSLPPSILTRLEQMDNIPLRTLYQRFDHCLHEITCLIPESHRREPLSYRLAGSLKALLLLDDWCRMVLVKKLEEQYQMHLGQIISLGETASHLTLALAALVEAGDRQASATGLLRRHAFSLRHGLSPDLQSLHRHFSAILSRADFVSLYQAEIISVTKLCELNDDELGRIISKEHKLLLLSKKLKSVKEEVEVMSMPVGDKMLAASEPDLIEIDGTCEQERFLVRINGFPVRLTGKSFKYLTKLAWSRLAGDGGWIYKEDIEMGFNQARYLYRMKNEIAIGFRSAWPIIENNRLGYYRLQVEPCKIRMNQDNLKSHPDWEIRNLFVGPDTAGAVN